MNRNWQIISLTLFVIFWSIRIVRYINRPEGNAQIISESFERQWHYNDGYTTSRVKDILKENHMFYANFYTKKGINEVDEVLVACTDDDKAFTYFKCNKRTERIASIVDDGISKPRLSNIIMN